MLSKSKEIGGVWFFGENEVNERSPCVFVLVVCKALGSGAASDLQDARNFSGVSAMLRLRGGRSRSSFWDFCLGVYFSWFMSMNEFKHWVMNLFYLIRKHAMYVRKIQGDIQNEPTKAKERKPIEDKVTSSPNLKLRTVPAIRLRSDVVLT